MNRFARLSLVVAAALALLLGACGDDDGGNTVASNTNDETTETTAGSATTKAEGGEKPKPGPSGNVVELKNLKFDPDEITVKVGDTVTWKWAENVLHNVTEEDEEFKSGNEDSGTFEHTFEEAGTYEYTCTLHAGMDGTVEVEE
jgi:plastocyanin